METDTYVAKRLGDNASVLSNDIRFRINDLWLRRYFYRVLVGKRIHGQPCLPETQWQYLAEQLWATAHAAAGLIFGLLPEVEVVPLSEGAGGTTTCLPGISEEDGRWLGDAMNDSVV